MYKLLGRSTSGNVQKVIFLFEELGVPYEREDYGRQFENTTTPEYRALNPNQKVPTLVDGDLVVWESNTILRYLAGKSNSPLYPSELAARTHIERWMDWTLATLNPVYLAGFRDAKKSDTERAPDTAKNLAAELAILEQHLAGSAWVGGSDFSLADVCMGPIVRRCVAFPFGLPAMPNIAAWLGKLNQRAAFTTATAAG